MKLDFAKLALDDGLLTISEAAKILKIPSLQLRRLLQGNKLPAVKNGRGVWCVPVQALREYAGKPKAE
jgi:excisionase family DNA binding protein